MKRLVAFAAAVLLAVSLCPAFAAEEPLELVTMDDDGEIISIEYVPQHKATASPDDMHVPVYLPGDATGNGSVGIEDVARIKKYLAAMNPKTGISSFTVDPGADTTGNGKIALDDVTRLKKYLAATNPKTGISSVAMGHSFTPVAPENYFQYNALSTDRLKTIYTDIAAGVAAGKYKIPLTLGTKAEIKEAYFYFLNDHPECFWLSHSFASSAGTAPYIITLFTDGTSEDTLSLTLEREPIEKQIREYYLTQNAFLSTLSEKDGLLLNELKIHDHVVSTIDYVDKGLPSDYSIYGAAMLKKCVCEGYSKYFQQLCRAVGIEATQVSGGNHMWNAVEIEGDWYFVDCTWDDGSRLYHDYFNITETQLTEDHILDSDAAVPECAGTAAAYQNHFCAIADGDSISGTDKAAAEMKRMGVNYITVYIGDADDISDEAYWALCDELESYGITVSGSYSISGKYVYIKTE